MTEAMIQQTFYHGINTTNQCVMNQLVGGNFMNTPYAEACDILDDMADTFSAWQSQANVPQGDANVIHLYKELHDHNQAIAELTKIMNQLAKSQLQQVQALRQVNAMEGVNMLVNKRRQSSKQMQSNQDQFEQGDSGYNQDDGYGEQNEEVLYANNYQGHRGNAPNQKWRSQGNNQNWGNQDQGNWNNNNNNSKNWGSNNQNWGNNSNWGGKKNQGGWNNGNQGNWGPDFQRPPMYQQPNNPPPFLSHGPSSSNNEMGRIELMFEQMMKKNANSNAQLASHNTSICNLEVQLGQISQSLNTLPKGELPSDMVVHPKGGNNTSNAMAVTTRSGRGGETSTSKQKEVVSDEAKVKNDDIPIVDEQGSRDNLHSEVRIDIHDNAVET
ncbi:uncharacterized protein [Nicotiana sylvestris]|uniref:uncharacterized protein n=1 Tax=Nicotiana sylvestris TaxID=4096 RepID=UPI00388C70AC